MSRAKSAPGRRPAPAVGASELAQMGVCERRVLFEHRHGRRRTRAQAAAIERGRLAHLRFFHARGRDSVPDATSLLAGHRAAAQAKAARPRRRRDRGLRRQPLRRWVMRICDRWAAAVCAWLDGRPGAQRVVRVALRPFIRYAARWLTGREHEPGD